MYIWVIFLKSDLFLLNIDIMLKEYYFIKEIYVYIVFNIKMYVGIIMFVLFFR